MYKKNQKEITEKKLGYFQKDGTGSTIYIGNLTYNKTQVQIKDLFAKFGPVKYVKIVTDTTTGKSKGIAFVQMPNKLEAAKAIKSLNNTVLDERTLKVSIATPRESDKMIQKEKKIALNPEQIQEIPNTEIKTKKRKRDKGLKLLFNHLNS